LVLEIEEQVRLQCLSKNDGYVILDNTKISCLELNSKLSNSWNNFIAGYDKQIEVRALQGGGLFPTIDILNGSNTWQRVRSFYSKELSYSTLHLQIIWLKLLGSIHCYLELTLSISNQVTCFSQDLMVFILLIHLLSF
jgi:hypothetical protein